MLKKIKDRMKGQDNRCTADPIYVVQQKRRIFGVKHGYTDNFAWTDDDGNVIDCNDPEAEEMNEYYDNNYEWPEGWTRTGYIEEWVFVQPFFSFIGAEKYIEANRHNLEEPRVYVDSAYRNDEWKAVREVLMKEELDEKWGVLCEMAELVVKDEPLVKEEHKAAFVETCEVLGIGEDDEECGFLPPDEYRKAAKWLKEHQRELYKEADEVYRKEMEK